MKDKKIKKESKADVDKQFVKIFRIYPSFLYNRLDKWLEKMSLNGLHVVHAGWFFFIFEKGSSQHKVYFTHGLVAQEKKYKIGLKHPNFEKLYGVKKKKSKINANEKKKYEILEIDVKRIDIQNDTGYKRLVDDRNRLYLQHFITNAGLIFAAFITWILLRTFLS